MFEASLEYRVRPSASFLKVGGGGRKNKGGKGRRGEGQMEEDGGMMDKEVLCYLFIFDVQPPAQGETDSVA